MARESVEQLRSAIVADTDELRILKGRREALRKEAADVGREERKVSARRARRIKRARTAGATTEQLAGDTGLTQQRIRQLAPARAAKPKAPGAAHVDEQLVDEPAPRNELVVDTLGAIMAAVKGEPSPAAAVVTYVKREQLADRGFPREGEHVEQLGATGGGKRPAAELLVVERQDDEPEPSTSSSSTSARSKRPSRSRGELDASRGVAGIFERARRALETNRGDVEAATAELVADAVPDAMRLLDASRAGATYDFTAHPSVPAPLKRPSRKAADQIWEGRPRYVNPVMLPGMTVDALDVNGAYLSALRRVHLPIGRLVEDRPGTPFDRRRSGIYLIEPIVWRHKGIPNPLGDGREERGPVWISGATMRLLQRAAKLGFGTEPEIMESHTSGASENLLTKFGDVLAAARRDAIAADDVVTLEYVKAMYSKFVSTAGDSRANADLFRPEWVHEIRSQAYANLWYKAAKVRAAGIAIARMSGTDELHISAAWRETLDDKGRPLFLLGRELSEMKIKATYDTRGDRA